MTRHEAAHLRDRQVREEDGAKVEELAGQRNRLPGRLVELVAEDAHSRTWAPASRGRTWGLARK